MDELSLEAQEIKTMAKKIFIAEIKLDEIMEGARNCHQPPPELIEMT